MPHDHGPPHTHGHNHAQGEHLHSHMHEEDPAGDLQVLADEFIEAFTTARDKSAFLELAGVPREIPDEAGGPALKLVDVKLTTEWQVGTASPSFGSAELSYLPYPGPMITERANLSFIYVSARRMQPVDLRDHLSARMG
ncbi:MAG: hypothetical protein AAGF74_02290 [Pseudomonadota bacterium]